MFVAGRCVGCVWRPGLYVECGRYRVMSPRDYLIMLFSVISCSSVVSRLSIACVSLMASDLLIVAIFVRMCWRCVVSLGLSLMYMYRFLAVLESCIYIRR